MGKLGIFRVIGGTRAKKEIMEFTVNQAILGVPYTINLLPLDYAVVQLLSWKVSNMHPHEDRNHFLLVRRQKCTKCTS